MLIHEIYMKFAELYYIQIQKLGYFEGKLVTKFHKIRKTKNCDYYMLYDKFKKSQQVRND